MPLEKYFSISLRVLSDWRVIAIALLTLGVWAVLRYVGMVYRRPVLRPRARPPAPAAKPAPAKRRGAQPEGKEEAMVE
jgi:hypothetical protein